MLPAVGIATHYCNSCNERIEHRELDSGQAVQFEDVWYCKACKEEVLEDRTAFRVAAQTQPKARPKKAPSAQTQPKARPKKVSSSPGGNPVRPSGTPRVRAGGDRQQAGAGGRKAAGQPVALYVGLAVAGVVVFCVLLLLALQPGADRAADATDPPKRPQKPAATPDDPSPEQAARHAELDRRYRVLRSKERASSDMHLDLLRGWEGLLSEARGTPLERKAAEGVNAARQRLEAEARKSFEEIKQNVARLIAAGDYRTAVARWEAFSPQLRTPEWVRRVAQERRRVEEARAAAETQRRGSLVRGDIPQGGRQVRVFDGQAIDNWTVKQGTWTVRDATLAVDTTSGGRKAFGYVFYRGADGKRRLFRDLYQTFEFQIIHGSMSVYARVPRATPREGQRLKIDVGTGADAVRPRTWYRAHLVVRGRSAQFWVEDALSLSTPEDFSAIQGALGFGAPVGSRFLVRKMSVRLLGEGGLLRPSAPNMTRASTPYALFNGKDLSNWQGANQASWAVNGQEIRPRSPKGKSSYIYRGEPSWTDVQLRFEVKALSGKLQICLRWSGSKQTFFELDGSQISDRSRWLKVIVDVQGDLAYLSVPQLKKTSFKYVLTDRGQLGFLLSAGGSCTLRGLQLRVYR